MLLQEKKKDTYQGKIRAFVEKVSDDEKAYTLTFNWSIVDISGFTEGLCSNIDSELSYPFDVADSARESGECIIAAFSDTDFFKNAKIDDVFEIVGDYHCDSWKSGWEYEEWDFEDWLENVKVHKLNKQQIIRFLPELAEEREYIKAKKDLEGNLKLDKLE